MRLPVSMGGAKIMVDRVSILLLNSIFSFTKSQG